MQCDQVSCRRFTVTNAALRPDGSLHIGVPERALYLLAPMLIAFAVGIHQLPGVIAGGLTGPDSYMRLVRLEDKLRQHQIAYVVVGDGSGAGTLLHWSHLLDLVLSLLAAPLRWTTTPRCMPRPPCSGRSASARLAWRWPGPRHR